MFEYVREFWFRDSAYGFERLLGRFSFPHPSPPLFVVFLGGVKPSFKMRTYPAIVGLLIAR